MTYLKERVAYPQDCYLSTAIIEHDNLLQKRKNKRSGIIALVLLFSIVLLPFLPYDFLIFIDVMLFLSFLIGGIYLEYETKTYREVGTLELTKNYFAVHLPDRIQRFEWDALESVTLTYVVFSGQRSMLPECWFAFRSDDQIYFYEYKLEKLDHRMSQSLRNICEYLKKHHTNVTVFSEAATFLTEGAIRDKLEKERKKYL